MVRLQSQPDSLLPIVEGEDEVELGVGVDSVGGGIDDGVVY